MKKILCSFFVLLAIVMTVSCNKRSAKETATIWLNDFYHMDYEGAKKISTEQTKNIVTQYEQLAGVMSDSAKIHDMRKLRIMVKGVKEKGDTAEATYTVSYDSTKDETLELIKSDGKWLVVFTKNDQASSADTSAIQPPEPDSTDVPANDTTMQDATQH